MQLRWLSRHVQGKTGHAEKSGIYALRMKRQIYCRRSSTLNWCSRTMHSVFYLNFKKSKTSGCASVQKFTVGEFGPYENSKSLFARVGTCRRTKSACKRFFFKNSTQTERTQRMLTDSRNVFTSRFCWCTLAVCDFEFYFFLARKFGPSYLDNTPNLHPQNKRSLA